MVVAPVKAEGKKGCLGLWWQWGLPHMLLLAPLVLPHKHGCGASTGRWECAEVGSFGEWRVGMPE